MTQNRGGRNKTLRAAYNNVVEWIVSECLRNSAYLTYLYNVVSGCVKEGRAELSFADGRACCRIFSKEDILPVLLERMTEIVGVGYKYRFLDACVRVCLPRREKGLLLSALIAADLEVDREYILPRLVSEREFCIDGMYHFRMAALREKWQRIASYIPESFSGRDLKNFSGFLVHESRRTVYLQGQSVFREDFSPLRLSRLTGEESAEREIMLADAGYVKCLGTVSERMGEFLQKYYPERAVFS